MTGILIENTSWKVLAYGIYARVIDVSADGTSERSERVRLLIKKQRVRKILNLSKVLKFAATHLPQNDNENEVSAFS